MKIDLPYVQAVQARGKLYTYYRRNGERQRIKGVPGSAEWLREYERIHASFEQQPDDDGRAADALGRVIEAYLNSPEYKQLKPSTRKDYKRYTDWLAEHYGTSRLRTMPTDFKIILRDKFADRPAKANYMVRILRLLCSFAEDRPSTFKLPANWRNPAARPKALKTGEGHRPWEDYEIDRFRKKWPAETIERVAFELLLNTAQRGGDVVKMIRQQYRNGWVSVPSQEKTGERVDVPASVALRAILDPWLETHAHVVVITGSSGKALGIDYFRHMMRNAFRTANLPDDCTIHGLRYTAATILRELGLEWQDIASITGHETMQMVKKYTEKRRRAARAIARLDASENGQAQ